MITSGFQQFVALYHGRGRPPTQGGHAAQGQWTLPAAALPALFHSLLPPPAAAADAAPAAWPAAALALAASCCSSSAALTSEPGSSTRR